MPGHGRRVRAGGLFRSIISYGMFLALVVLANFSLNKSISAQTIDWRMPPKWHQDAEPTDLCFVDQQTGWVVGDRGLVLKTDDGGKTWQSVKLSWDRYDDQAPAVTCRFESVVFVSPSHGWIAGGYTNPRATSSTGVLYATSNGGKSWSRIQSANLPKINQLIFANPMEGIAIGDGNALKPSGVYQTRDGGKSWSAATEGKISSWKTGSQFGNTIVMSNCIGQQATYSNHKITEAFITDTQPTSIRQMQMIDERFGFAVGDRGNFLQTRNGGLSWLPSEFKQDKQPLQANNIDFRTLSLHRDRVWIAGSPGTHIYTRNAQSTEWQRFETPVKAPLTRLQFVDASHGWAVSCCGDIIHTSDGGANWSIQRRGTKGVALLQVGERPDELIPELFCKYCCDDDYIGAALLLTTRQAVSDDETPVSIDKLRQALSRVGGSFVDGCFFDDQDQNTQDRSEQMQEYLVRQIRILQPRVIAIPSGRVKNEQLSVRALVLSAVRRAAESDQFEPQIADSGLQTWQVGKVIVMDRGDVASLKISAAHYMMGFGALVADHAAASRMLLNQRSIETRSLSLTTIYTSPFAAGSGNSLFGSIENTDAAIPVRNGRHQATGNMIQMRQLASKRKTINRILEWSVSVTNPTVWNNSLSELTLQLDSAAAGVWLFELASRCDARGDADLALETHLYLTKNYRQHPMAVASFRWLFNYYSSAEQAHVAIQQPEIQSASAIETELSESTSGIQSRPVKRIVDGVEVVQWEVEDPRSADTQVQQTSLTTQEKKSTTRRRYQQARAIAQSFSIVDPTALDTDRYRLARIGLNQKIDPLISIEAQLKRLAVYEESAAADAALLELGILARENESDAVPREKICHFTDERPWLDGKLDDAAWLAASDQAKIPLISPRLINDESSQPSDQMLIMADDEFLYIGLRCRQSADVTYETSFEPRPRDSQLQDSDRVEIAIDIDRDYETYFLFSVDSYGRVADSLGSNLAWNPTWFVATHITNDEWFAEIAIPLSEISSQGDFWSIGVNRHIRNQLVSTCWNSSKKRGAAMIPHFDSLHLASLQQQADLHALPLQAFQLVRMPWTNKQNEKTTSLPTEE